MRKLKIKKLLKKSPFSPTKVKMIWKAMKMSRKMIRMTKETLTDKAKITKNKLLQLFR